jgi:hypothetical protein
MRIYISRGSNVGNSYEAITVIILIYHYLQSWKITIPGPVQNL